MRTELGVSTSVEMKLSDGKSSAGSKAIFAVHCMLTMIYASEAVGQVFIIQNSFSLFDFFLLVYKFVVRRCSLM